MADVNDNEFEELPEREPAWLRLDRATVYRKKSTRGWLLADSGQRQGTTYSGLVGHSRRLTSLSIAGQISMPSATNTGIITAARQPSISMSSILRRRR